jgi:hypothetical protein
MRASCTGTLVNWIEENPRTLNSIAVVGGSSKEPELLKILTLYPLAEVTFFGIENVELNTAFIELDLNLPSKINLKYDLVICAQVLEHVWNLNIAFENLSKLLNSDNGLLWINCPASNMVHGSPEYFSAGYSVEMLTQHLEIVNLEVVLAGSFGSRRLYFFTHALQFWPTKFELEHPILTFRPLRSYGRKIVIETIRGFFGRTYSVLLSSKQTSEPQYATESFALAKSKGESPL